MEREQIFNYSQPREFLAAILRERKSRNPSYSISAWAKQLGFTNHSLLSQIIRGERKLKPSLGQQIIMQMNLDKKEQKYFELLILLDNAKEISEKEIYIDLLKSLNPKKIQGTQNSYRLTVDFFRMIADWYHTAILEMISLSYFKSDTASIVQILGGKVSFSEVEQAIERMINLDLIARDEEGNLTRIPEGSVLANFEVPSEAVKHHHQQMIDQGVHALLNESVEKRDVRGMTLTIQDKDRDKILKIIKQCHDDILEFAVSDKTGDETCQFNTQLFNLSKKTKDKI